ncbi:hypothetical protein [Massilia endophytica]|uniref:hypothetical protein n=1 Tax=Massilia endophytica TaxID=2899220 RepID=UPI001E327ACC|nr:hypothetical protein [Massilia endophytica]UGQ48739.1 hypothetical protein LSQ66_09845 [Massilia endophytica]
MEIVSKALSLEEVLPHFIETLSQIQGGSADLARTLATGTVSVLAPDCTAQSRLYDFRHGGLLAPASLAEATAGNVQPVANTAGFLAKELVGFGGMDCLVHDPLKQPGEASDTDGQAILIDGSLFYLNRQCMQSEADLVDRIRRNTLSWHFLQFIGRYRNSELSTLKSVLLHSVCIVVGAYDGESYLIWRRD